MATRRSFHSLTKKLTSFSQTLINNPSSKTLINNPCSKTLINGYKIPHLKIPSSFNTPITHFSTINTDNSETDDESDNDVDYESELDNNNNGGILSKRVYTAEEREAKANEIGFKVIGPLHRSDRVFKPYEPVFAVVQIGSHQFKVSNGDCVYTERLKFCEVNDKLILNKVLMLGSSAQTIIGRPILPDAAVHAIVEEHALDAKVIIFKKKRRKNYRRTKGHRQELTKLRITDIQGIEKPEITASADGEKVANTKKPEKVEVSAYKKSKKVAVPA